MINKEKGCLDAYRMRIAFCCFLLMFANQGLTASSFNVYQSYLVEIPFIGDIGGSVILTVRSLVSLIAIFCVGFYYRRFDLRTGAFLATLFTVAAFIVYGLATSLGAFCFGSFLAGVGYGFGGMVASTALIGNWFRGRIGTASGVASMGTGVSGILIPLMVSFLVTRFGLSTSFFAEALLALLIGILLLTFVRSTPVSAGFASNGIELGNVDEASAERVRRPAIDLPPSLQKLMLLAVFLLGATTLSSFGYFSVLVSTSDHTLVFAAVATSILGTIETFGKALVGRMFDRLGTRHASIIFFITLISGLLLCAAIGYGWKWAVLPALVVYGVGIALPTAGVSIWALEFSTMRSQMRVIRSFQIAYAFGGFAFNMLPGIIMEVTGSYALAYVVFACFTLTTGLLVLFVHRRFQYLNEMHDNLSRCESASE